jgi:hypothetical protein
MEFGLRFELSERRKKIMQIKRMLIASLLFLVIVSCASQQATVTPVLTNTPLLSATSTTQPTSTELSLTATTVPVVLIEEHQLNSYTVRVLREKSLNVVVIEKDGKIKFKSKPWAGVEIMDVTNDNEPEIIVWQADGGDLGFSHIWVFQTDTNLSKILETPPFLCASEFKDLNNDGTFEFQTCDHTFVYYKSICPFDSGFTNVVFKYEQEQGYKLATPNFPQIYNEAISVHTKQIQDFSPDSSRTQEILHDETQCTVLPLVLDYLYSGQRDNAWKVLEDYYPFEDLNNFKSDILQKAQNSPFFMEP